MPQVQVAQHRQRAPARQGAPRGGSGLQRMDGRPRSVPRCGAASAWTSDTRAYISPSDAPSCLKEKSTARSEDGLLVLAMSDWGYTHVQTAVDVPVVWFEGGRIAPLPSGRLFSLLVAGSVMVGVDPVDTPDTPESLAASADETRALLQEASRQPTRDGPSEAMAVQRAGGPPARQGSVSATCATAARPARDAARSALRSRPRRISCTACR
jgi:hypothetical protein